VPALDIGPGFPGGEDVDGGGVEVDTPSAVRSLASRFAKFIADGDEAPVDRHGGFVQVDVGPAEAQEFAATHPGVGGEPERREQPMSDPSLQKLAELFGSPGLGFVFGDGAESWCVGDVGDVAGEHSSFDCSSEGAADDEVDVEHGLGCERPHVGVGGSEFGVVEAFEVGDVEASDRGSAEGGEDVAVDLAAIPIPR
jgi:hypothetical protein